MTAGLDPAHLRKRLLAIDVLLAGMAAGPNARQHIQARADATRRALEVLDRDDLLQVAVCLAVEPARLVAPAEDVRVRQRLSSLKLELMWQAS